MRRMLVVLLTLLAPTPVICQPFRIVVSEVAATRGAATVPFGTIGDLLALPDGRVVVSDDVVRAVWVWDPSTDSVSRLARPGEGPGEVQTPVQIARRPEGGFGVYDPGRSRVLLFNSDLEFERAILISGLISNPKDLLFNADGSFVIAGGRLTDPAHLQLYGAEGERFGEWGTPGPMLEEAHSKIQMAGGALRALEDGGWLFGSAMPYRVTRFSSPGFNGESQLFEDLALVPEAREEYLTRRLEGGAVAFLWWFDRITGVFEVPAGILTVVSRFYSSDSVWSVHDEDGHLAGRVEVDRPYEVYDRIDEGLYVGSYRDPLTDERIAVLLRVEIGSMR